MNVGKNNHYFIPAQQNTAFVEDSTAVLKLLNTLLRPKSTNIAQRA